MAVFQKVRQLFIDAHPRILRNEDRRAARLFSILMLIHSILVIALLIVVDAAWRRLMGSSIWGDENGWVVLGGVFVILSTVLIPLVAPFVADPNAEIALLATAMMQVLLTTMVFSERWVFLVLVGTMGVAALELLRAPGTVVRAEKQQQHGDGRWCWLEAVATNCLAVAGVSGILINIRDALGEIRKAGQGVAAIAAVTTARGSISENGNELTQQAVAA